MGATGSNTTGGSGGGGGDGSGSTTSFNTFFLFCTTGKSVQVTSGNLD